MSKTKRDSDILHDPNDPIGHVRAIKARYEDRLLARPGVVSVGVGLCQQAGTLTDEVCIVVMVREKLPPDNLPPDETLPVEIEGVRVDVQESGEIVI